MEEKNPIQSAQRIFSVYEYVCRSGNAGLSQITEALGLNKSTVHRMLASLIYMDYVKQDKFTGEYTPTFKTVELGQTILGRLDLPGRVRPYLQELSDSTGETVHLVRRDGTDVVYVDKIEPLHSRSDSIRMASQIGRRRPMYCAGVGKALMASMPSLNTQAWRLVEIPGLVPDPRTAQAGCAFAPRCPLADERCRAEMPQLQALAGDHTVACFAAEEGRG